MRRGGDSRAGGDSDILDKIAVDARLSRVHELSDGINLGRHSAVETGENVAATWC